MQRSKLYFFFILFSIVHITSSLKLKNKFKPLTIGHELSDQEVAETLSDLALSKLYERLGVFNSTSCRCTAKFILLAIGGIRVYDSLKNITLTDDIDKNIELMKEKLNKNYILQIEIRNNHHFVIFRKNNEKLYLLQSFQNTYTLANWMNSSQIMEPYLTIDEFFSTFRTLIKPDSFKDRDEAIVKLFYPPELSDDPIKRKSVIDWFYMGFATSVKLINVNYTPFNFKQNQNNRIFKALYYDRSNHYDISMDERVHVDFKDKKYIFPEE